MSTMKERQLLNEETKAFSSKVNILSNMLDLYLTQCHLIDDNICPETLCEILPYAKLTLL